MRWFKITEAVYSNDLAYLRDYLKSGIDPYDFGQFLPEYLMETGWDEDSAEDMDVSSLTEEQIESFKAWIESSDKASEMMRYDPTQAPSYLHMEYQNIVPPSTWLIHFSDAAQDIGIEGFTKGHEDMQTLGLTTHFMNRGTAPGWNFAFDANSREAASAASAGRYGAEAVMFQAAGVQAYHYGDEENQIMFRGDGVQHAIPLRKYDGDWVVESTRDGRALYQGEFSDVVNWVQSNYQQYRRVL